MHDCGHLCCDIRYEGSHSHTVSPDICTTCSQIEETGRKPTVSLEHPILTMDSAEHETVKDDEHKCIFTEPVYKLDHYGGSIPLCMKCAICGRWEEDDS